MWGDALSIFYYSVQIYATNSRPYLISQTMLEKVNAVLHNIVKPLNIINIIVGFFIGIAYVYLPFTSILGLILGIVMATSGTASMAISYYFTSKNTSNKKTPAKNEKKQEPLKNTPKSNLFLCLTIPTILLCAVSSFFSMYTIILLLAAALAVPFAAPVTLTLAIVLASVMAVGTLINLWKQTHNIWESLKVPEKAVGKTKHKRTHAKLHAMQQTSKLENKKQLVSEPSFKLEKTTKRQRASIFFGSLFGFTRSKHHKEQTSFAPPKVTVKMKTAV